MHPDKSRGPDGMNPSFYQAYWDIVGDHITIVFLDALNKGKMPKGWNHTSIMLISKKERPEKIADLRTIALCNVLHKIIAKTLSNRVKHILPIMIS